MRSAVTVHRDGDTLIVSETGHAEIGGKAYDATDATRWTFSGRSISIEHLRYGPEHPVFLVTLTERDDGNWRSVEPHVCDEDLYHAELRIVGNELHLTWRVSGPKKDQTIRTVYAGDPASSA